MHKLFNAVLVLTVLVSGFILYSLEHKTRGLERQVASLQKKIGDAREDMKLLDAEWSSLTRPERIKDMAGKYLHLQTMQAVQIVKAGELGQKVPAEPQVKLEANDEDTIGAILKKMQ